MAEFINPPQGQGQGQQPPAAPGSASDFLNPMQKAEAANAAVPAAPMPQAPPQEPQGAGMGATQPNPVNAPDEEASPEEQKQYEDLFVRVMGAINDNRTGNGAEASPADAVVKLLSVKGKAAHESIGAAAALTMIQVLDIAKRNGVEYDPRIVQEVGMDAVVELTEIADMSGAIKGIPEDESEEYNKLIELAVLEAAKVFGEQQLRTGQAPRQQAMAEIDEQMQREADSGELDDWQMEELDPEMRSQVMQSVQAKTKGQGAPNG